MSGYLLPYSVGTVSVTNASKTVTGDLTAWADNVKPGDLFEGPDGRFYAISAAAISNTSFELIDEYQGSTATEQAYKVHRVSPGWGATSDVNLRVANLMNALRRNALTSNTEVEIDTGEKVFTVQAGFPIGPGARVTIANPAAPENVMNGVVIAYEGTSLTIDVETTGGSGTFSDWAINFAGSPGPQGVQGEQGPKGDQGDQGPKGDKGDKGDTGNKGWSPVFAVVTDGDRRVLQVEDWVGGEGTPPAAGKYVGADGLVEDINDAVDIRGPKGQDGAGVGTVTQIDTGAGLSGGPITSSGEISIDIDSLDEETDPADDDVFIGQRAADGDLYKIKAQNLPGSGGGRELLTAPRTYYVNGSTGSDSNDGLTSGTAFATIQKAVDVVAGLDLGIFDVTTSIAAGTYAEAVVLKPLVGAGRHYIVGDEGTPANVKVHAPSGSDAFYAPSTFSTYHLRGMQLQALGSGAFSESAIHLNGNGSVYIRNIRFMECEMAHIRVGSGAYLDTEGDYTIAGGASYHVAAISGTAQIRLNTVTLVGTPSFSKVGVSAFVWADRLAFVQVTNVTFVGSATGKRYNVSTNSVVFTSVGLQLPGDSAGTATLGGQYV